MKYAYKGKSLTSYCKEVGILPDTVYHRMKVIKKENPNMTLNEVIENAISYVNKNIKYTYKGKSLTSYCKEVGILPTTVYKRMKVIKKENPNMTLNEVIENAISYVNKNIKYTYKGKSLTSYCKEVGILPNIVYQRIKVIKKENPNMALNEVIENAISYVDKKAKYSYKGKSLAAYCDETKENYYTICKRIERIKKSRLEVFSNDELVLLALKKIQIEELLDIKMETLLSENGIFYILNLELAEEFLDSYFKSYIDKNIDIKMYTKNKVKTLIYNYKKSKTS